MGAGRTATQRLMTQVATVYTETVSTGKSTTVLLYALACRLVHPSDSAPGSSAERAELMADRDLWWNTDVTLPEQCRISIDGVLYQPVAGTFQALGDGQTIVARRCAVVRVQTASF
jgi:hypothetical protein